MNRHAAALAELWEWAAERDHCEGRNPFKGKGRRLRVGVNVSGYRAWEDDELATLFQLPLPRADMLEIILVAMHSGMRIGEIAGLTWGQVREADGVPYFQVEAAKTPAGNRQVPIHPALSWLTGRPRGAPGERLWAGFNLEGPGREAGADASRMFSTFKSRKGFIDRTKTFHSFRKNVTRQIERAGVHESEWAQVFGHERGFTYRTYNADGIALSRKAEIIGIIGYPGVSLPTPDRPE